MLSLAFVLHEAQFKFEGGKLDVFSDRVRAFFERSTVVVPASEPRFDKVEVNWPVDSSGKPLLQEKAEPIIAANIAGRVRSDLKFGSSVAFRPKVLPWYRFPTLYAGRSPSTTFVESFDLVAIEGKSVMTSNGEGKYFLPVYLSFLPFSKKASAHKFLERTPMAFSRSSWTETEFLEAVCFAIGGQIVESENAFFIDVDLEVLRKQTVAYYQELARTEKSSVFAAKARFQAEAVQVAPKETLRKWVDLENSWMSFELPMASKAHQLAMEYARAYLAAAERGSDSRVSAAIAEIVKVQGRLDRPCRASFDTLGNINLMVTIGNEKGGIDF